MGTRNFHWDPIDDCVMSETDQNGDTIATYTHEPGSFGPLLSENRGGTEFYHHYDALGSTTMLTNDAGTVTDTFQYDAWGNNVARTGTTPTPYQWVGCWGYQSDVPTGGFYIRARTYQPTTARWTSLDPLHLSLSSVFLAVYGALKDARTQAFAYHYSAGAPVNMLDPTGLLAASVERPTVSPCGGWSVTLEYIQGFKKESFGKKYLLLQIITVYNAGTITDCAPVGCIANCQAKLPEKRCTPCTYLELLGVMEPDKSSNALSVADNNGIPPYSQPGCTSKGSLSITATVRLMLATRNNITSLGNLKLKGEETCDPGCDAPIPLDLGEHRTMQPGEVLPGWNNRDKWFASVDVRTSTRWNCCGCQNNQITTFADGTTKTWPS